MDKYYIPEISEFFVRFEFEENQIDSDWKSYGWEKKIVDVNFNFKLASEYIGLYRVKYLSQDDIESLGFNITKDNEDIELSLESKRYIGGPSAGDDYKIIILYGLDNKEMWIYKKCNNGYEYDLFKGLIKNKSELIKLLKQLQIG